MIKGGITVLILLLGIILSTLGYCQNCGQGETIKRVTGTVADIDWVTSRLVVKTADFGVTDEISFLVFKDTEITKGENTIRFSDVNLTNKVAVEYYSNSLIGLKAVRITIEE